MSNIMYYNAGMFFQLSEGHPGATVFIFKRYFELYKEFTRVYEHKLSILALSSIFTLPQIPPLILQSIDKIFLMILSLIERVQLIREKKKSFGCFFLILFYLLFYSFYFYFYFYYYLILLFILLI